MSASLKYGWMALGLTTLALAIVTLVTDDRGIGGAFYLCWMAFTGVTILSWIKPKWFDK